METIFFRTREDERKTDSRTKTHTQHWILPRILALRPTFLRLRWSGWSASIKTKHEAVGRAINSNYREPCGRRKKLSTLLIHLVALLVSVSWPRNRPKVDPHPLPSPSLPPPPRMRPTAVLSFPSGHENFDSPIMRHERGISFPIFEHVELGLIRAEVEIGHLE